MLFVRRPAVRQMAARAVFVRFVDWPKRKYARRMAAQTVFVGRLDARMRFVAFVAIEPGHGNAVGK